MSVSLPCPARRLLLEQGFLPALLLPPYPPVLPPYPPATRTGIL
ncbi:hypothetical protein ABT075_03395 [Streptomyces sp. NPDC002677]